MRGKGQAIIPRESPPGDSQATLLQELSSLDTLLSAPVACPRSHSLPSASSRVHSTRPSDRPLVPSKELSGLVCVVSHRRDLAPVGASSMPGPRDTSRVTHLVALQQG